MINFQFFPRSQGVTPRIRQIIDCFKKVDEIKNNSEHLKSNEMLAMLRPHLESIDFSVETGKSASEQIYVPVLFSENDEVDYIEVDVRMSLDGKLYLSHDDNVLTANGKQNISKIPSALVRTFASIKTQEGVIDFGNYLYGTRNTFTAIFSITTIYIRC